jgi:hypothetical protein
VNGKVSQKLKAVIKAARWLDNAHQQAGRIAVRNARRSLWARIRALQEECEVQYALPDKEPPAAHLTWEGKAERMTALGFDREIIPPPVWLKTLKNQPGDAVDLHLALISQMVVSSCAEYGVPVPHIEPDQVAALNLGGSGHLGIKDATFANVLRSLAKWIMWQQSELKFRRKRRSGGKNPRSKKASDRDQFTKTGIAAVNIRMLEILKLTQLLMPEAA